MGKWDNLKLLAERATPGLWETVGGTAIALPESHWKQELVGYMEKEADADFVASACPEVILELLEENERLRSLLSAHGISHV